MEIHEETSQAPEAQQAKRENEVDEVVMSDSVCHGLMYSTCTRKTKLPVEVKETGSHSSRLTPVCSGPPRTNFLPAMNIYNQAHAIT